MLLPKCRLAIFIMDTFIFALFILFDSIVKLKYIKVKIYWGNIYI